MRPTATWLTDADLLSASPCTRPPGLARDLGSAPDAASRHARLAQAVRDAGFDWLAYARIERRTVTHWYVPHAHAAWLRTATSADDPRFADALAACAPIVWDLDTLSARAGQRVVDGLQAHGIASGVWWSLPDDGRPDVHTLVALDARAAGRGWITDAVIGRALVIAASVHDVVSGLWPDAVDAPMSVTQREVLDCLCEGHSDKVIAARLQLSSHTVDYHMRQLRRRFAARNRVQLIHAAAHDKAPAIAHIW